MFKGYRDKVRQFGKLSVQRLRHAPRSFWLTQIVLLSWVFLNLAGGAGYQLYDAAQQRNAHYNYQPATNARFPIPVKGQPKPQEYQPNCQQPQGREDADLCAQWAAVAQVTETNRLTSLSLQLSIGALIFTIIGTGLLVWTLSETRAVSRRELRAYVSVKVVNLKCGIVEGKGINIAFDTVAHNGGMTPAYESVHFAHAAISSEEEASKNFSTIGDIAEGGFEGGFVIHSGEDSLVESRQSFFVDNKSLDDIINGRRNIYVFGVTSYLDTFLTRRRTDFCYVAEGEAFRHILDQAINSNEPTPMKWRIAPFHNSAT